MKGDDVPDGDHVARHCGPKLLEIRGNKVVGVFWVAFHPDDEGVSVTWLEYFQGTHDDRLARVRQVIRDTRTVRPSHHMGVARVAAIKAAGRQLGVDLNVEHDPIEEPPEDRNLAHSLIKGIPQEGVELMELIAAEAIALQIIV